MKIPLFNSWFNNLSLRLAWRELRGGLSGFYIFLLALGLGVFGIAAVSAVTTAIQQALQEQGVELLGGDLEIRRGGGDLEPAVQDYLRAHGRVAKVEELLTLLQYPAKTQMHLVEVRAVDTTYPLVGKVQFVEPVNLVDVLSFRQNYWGAALDQSLVDQWQLKIGDQLRIGNTLVVYRATLLREPDRAYEGIKFAPRVLVLREVATVAGLTITGSLVRHRYRVVLPEKISIDEWQQSFAKQFNVSDYHIRTRDDPSPGFRNFIERIQVFLSLVGLTALLTGGIGIANAMRAYLEKQRATIATFKCLGASGATVLRIYLWQILLLSSLAIIVAVILGGTVPYLIKDMVNGALPLPDVIHWPVKTSLYSALIGYWVVLLFSLNALGAAQATSPATLFRVYAQVDSSIAPRRYQFYTALLAVGLVAFIFLTTDSWRLILGFVLGIAVAYVVFRLAAAALIKALAYMPHLKWPYARIALRNIQHQPRTSTLTLMSLGMGLSVLATIALVHANVQRQFNEDVPKDAPSLFFIDVQPFQIEALKTAFAGLGGIDNVKTVPMISGRIVKINDIPAEKWPDDSEQLRFDQRIALQAEMPEGNTIVEGLWWSENSDPQVSVSSNVAESLGLTLGDVLTFSVAGQEYPLRLSSVREVNWASMGINFRFAVTPNAFPNAPYTLVTTVRAELEKEKNINLLLAREFSNVVVIPVRDMMALASEFIAKLSMAVSGAGLLTLVVGVLVLAGALAAGHQRRVYEAVVLKVLGARRRDLLGMYSIEYLLLGLCAVLLSLVVGVLASYGVVVGVLKLQWHFFLDVAASTTLSGLLITVVLGLFNAWRVLGERPAIRLREE
ncbi:MAG: FtsX-like permease family protein [Gammaproteobacteria bacterium]|nr:FtsX-like permease family protein [Gammaproteobacteria bacterium]